MKSKDGVRAPRSSAFLSRKLRGLESAIVEAVPRVLGNKDGEAVHDLRVAIRRLRTLLRLAEPIFGRFHTAAVGRSFTALQKATGDLRDEEALEETLESLEVKDKDFDLWRERRRGRARALRRAVLRRLEGGELRQAKTLLRALLVLPVKPSRDEALAKFARRCISRARKRVDGLRDVETTDVEGMHELRIAYKKLRYAAELLSEALPADLAAMAEPASRFQKRLGDIHDIDVALVTLARARGLTPETRGRVITELRDVRDRKVAKYAGEMSPADGAETPASPPAGAADGAPPLERSP